MIHCVCHAVSISWNRAVPCFCRWGPKDNIQEYVQLASGDISLSIIFVSYNCLGFPFRGLLPWCPILDGCVVFPLVIPITALVFIPVFHGLGVTTAYEYLRKRFSPAVQYAGSVLFIIQTLFYMAIVLFAPAIALEAVTNIPLWVTIIGTGLICSFYTALGGIKAVIWTDVFQFLVLFGSLIAVLIFGTKEAGGPSNVWNYNKNHSKLNFFVLNPDPTERLSLWSLIFGGAFNALPIWAVSQTAVQRFLTARTLKEAQKSVWYNLPGNVIMMTIVSLIGLVLFAYYKGDAPQMTTNDQILIYFVSGNLDQLQGLFIACLFAGTLSTVASGLNALAAVTLIDIVKAYRNGRQTITTFPAIDQASEEEAAKRLDYHDTVLSKLFTLGYGILTLALAFVAKYMGTLVQMANTVFGSIGGPLLGVFTLGVLYRRANSG
ncbi:putative sodium-dependent multivitamin transporter isoform X2, partial [Apostichopus japonicus]